MSSRLEGNAWKTPFAEYSSVEWRNQWRVAIWLVNDDNSDVGCLVPPPFLELAMPVVRVRRRSVRVILGVSFLAACGLLKGPAAVAEEEGVLPVAPSAWINSPPLSEESLRGKAAILWFYEES